MSSLSPWSTKGMRYRIRTWLRKVKNVALPPSPDLKDMVPQYRYTPILPGLIIPFSILLELPGIISDWYIRTEGDKTVETQSNPPLLNAALALSLAFAVIANATLILRFLEKHVKTNTIVCIASLTLHDIINIVVIIVFGVEHRHSDGFTYGQAFWTIIGSTAVSSVTNITLFVDLLRTPDFANSGSGLTRKQRSLTISVMILLAYIGFGAGVNSALLHLDFLNALYFTVATIETIGFGDITPQGAGRVFIIFYIVFGACNLALVIKLARDTVLEGLQVSSILRLRGIREKRQLTRAKRRILRRWQSAIEWRLTNAHQKVWLVSSEESKAPLWRWRRHLKRNMELNYGALTLDQLQGAALEAGAPLEKLLPEQFRFIIEQGEKRQIGLFDGSRSYTTSPLRMPMTHNTLGRMIAMLGYFALSTSRRIVDIDDKTTPPEAEEQGAAPVDTDEDEDRADVERGERKIFWVKLAVALTMFALFWMIGAVLFMASEHWSFGIAVYFCFESFSTLGYGDYTPKSPAGRAIFVVWGLLGVAAMTILISMLSEAYTSRYENVMERSVFLEEAKQYRSKTSSNESYDGFTTLSEAVTNTPTDKEKIESLPQDILDIAYTFREHVHFFKRLRNTVTQEAFTQQDPIPTSIVDLMDHIHGDSMHDVMRREILKNEETRETLYNISIEDGLGKIIAAAEVALTALQERQSPAMNSKEQ